MERKKEWELIGRELDYNCDYSYREDYYPLEDFIEELTEAKEKGATHVKFVGDIVEDELWDLEIFPMKLKIESDEEYEARLRRKAEEDLEAKREIEAEERAEYERLRAKFEK